MLALALLCMAPERVSALENRQIVSIFTENQTALKGQQFTVSVQMEIEEPLAAFNFFLYYDSSLLKLVSAEKGTIYPASSAPQILINEQSDRVTVAWYYNGKVPKPEEMIAGSGSCLDLTFEALEDLDDQTLLRLRNISCSNFDLQRYQPYLYYGDILVGDVNRDGRIGTLQDACLAHWIYREMPATKEQMLAADISGKNQITRDTVERFVNYVNQKETYLY